MSRWSSKRRPNSVLTFSPGAAGAVVGRDLPKPPDWTELSECQYIDPELFFPEKGGSTREAKAVCRVCEVRAECLEYALEHTDVGRFGIWGGMSEPERRNEMKRRQELKNAA